MLTTTIPASCARLQAETSALESAGAITMALTPWAIISLHQGDLAAQVALVLDAVDDQLVILGVLGLVLAGTFGHRREELVGQRLHHQRDPRLAEPTR